MFHDILIKTCLNPPSHEQEVKGVLKLFVTPTPAVFYYNKEDLDDSFLETAREFMDAGLIRLPFETCIFVKREEGKDVIAFLARDVGDGAEIMHVYTNGVGGGEAVGLSYNGGGVSFRRIFSDAYSYSDEELIYNAKCSAGNVIAAIMLLNSKYSNKELKVIGDRLNKKRSKKNKPPLINYTTISLRDMTVSTERGGTHASPKPHWRRGHIRTLSNGKRIPIEPCLVNWEPGEEIEDKIYKVSRD